MRHIRVKSEAEEYMTILFPHTTRRVSSCKSISRASKSRLLNDDSESEHSATPLLISLTMVVVINDAFREISSLKD